MSDTPPVPSPALSVLSTVGRPAVYLAIAVFLANMLCAWLLALRGAESIAHPLVGDRPTATSRALDEAPKASANGFTLLNRVLDAELQVRAVQNRQTLSIVAMAAAFAMMALGFALFVMGAEGAFQFSGTTPGTGTLVLKASAPGIFCFFLATAILIAALFGEVNLKTGAFQVLPDTLAGPPASAAPSSTATGVVVPELPPLGDLRALGSAP